MRCFWKNGREKNLFFCCFWKNGGEKTYLDLFSPPFPRKRTVKIAFFFCRSHLHLRNYQIWIMLISTSQMHDMRCFYPTNGPLLCCIVESSPSPFYVFFQILSISRTSAAVGRFIGSGFVHFRTTSRSCERMKKNADYITCMYCSLWLSIVYNSFSWFNSYSIDVNWRRWNLVT